VLTDIRVLADHFLIVNKYQHPLEGKATRVALLCRSPDLERLEGCRDGILHLLHCAGLYFFSNLEDKARKSRDLTGACSPIMLPVTVGLGGSMVVTLNALAPVPATGGVERFSA